MQNNVINTLPLIGRSTFAIPPFLPTRYQKAITNIIGLRYGSKECRSQSDVWSIPHDPQLVNGATAGLQSGTNGFVETKVVLLTPSC
jgi:hypothetical protein